MKLSQFKKKAKNKFEKVLQRSYRILLSVVRTFFKENYDEILPAHHTWKAPEKGFKINWVMP